MDESTDIDDVVNEVLIEHVKQRPSIYYTDAYTASDEQHWAEIQKETGIQSNTFPICPVAPLTAFNLLRILIDFLQNRG